ncbi:hypothetical protein KSP35_21765 [Aquihabitans sp. G128]|nr:hypothetical protein [Aquihabitans sp. G128]QXC60911.1 hypothetical protein KSP35_21765 [Aquihabitans sp. G128]
MMVTEAVPVRDSDGRVVGYLGEQFISLGAYAAARTRAESVIETAKVTG